MRTIAQLILMLLSTEQIETIVNSDDPALHRLAVTALHPYYTWTPRADRPQDFDEQAAFVEPQYRWDKEKKQYVYDAHEPIRVQICLGGTGSGKTASAAYKVARHVLETPPPRDRCPFWVIGDTYDVVCDVCWLEKMSNLIPESQIASFYWYRRDRRWPYAVLLKHPDDPSRIGWILEFKSYEQGLSAMKAKSIGGFWCNEEVPVPIVLEIQGRCREYDSPGWADFTPIEVVSPEWPEFYDNPPPGWRFYHLNTELNHYLADGWAKSYLSQIPEDLRETRRTGVFTSLRGAVFKEFRKLIHVIQPPYPRIQHDWRKIRGIDFGFNNPFVCMWVAQDRDDRYYVYDEHFVARQLNAWHVERINQREWDESQPWYGPTYSDHDAQERAELGALGINCTPANKAINQGIELLRSLMIVQADNRPRIFIFARCANLIREIISYRWPEGSDKRNPQDVPLDKDNHAVDALRYAIVSDRVKLNQWRPTTRRHVPDGDRYGVQFKRRA